MHDQFLQRPANGTEGQVAGHYVIACHLQQGLGNTFKIAGQRAVESLLTGQVRLLDEGRWTLAVPLPQLAQD